MQRDRRNGCIDHIDPSRKERITGTVDERRLKIPAAINPVKRMDLPAGIQRMKKNVACQFHCSFLENSRPCKR